MNEPRVQSPESRSNRLVHETSPYLQQHAHNPVDWYPWSEEALARAREENKPILLSIGYSACHWCHVMAHESFEDARTAEVMNRHFVNVKVDREERPDLDRVYQTAQQLLTQRQGGWPLTMFLSPDNHVPFFGGTYFPPEPRFGLPGFRDMLEHVAGVYHNEREAIHKQNAAFLEAMSRIQDTPGGCPDELDLEPVRKGVEGLLDFFDDVNGGFGGAPKFPQAPALELLLQYPCLDSGETGARAREAVRLTLEKMARGGIYDHLGGGFCRYAVDARWMIPHFEKMLYDNGPLLGLYAQAWHVTGDEAFRNIARETADWIIRDMQAPAGGYYSSLDADSEGHEGKFYTWTREEVESLLDGDEYHVFAARYGLDEPPNFEGKWHLHVAADLAQVAEANSISPAKAAELIEGARSKLRKTREDRIWPGRDEKILTSWNALAIRGMAIASLRLGEERYLASAERALTFIRDHMWRDGRLLASSKDGRGHLNAYLDDYAFLLEAIITLVGVRWSSDWFGFAQEITGVLLEQFHDPEHGGFYFTSHDHETLLQRRRDFMDDSTPSGNGVAARALMTLGHLTGDHKLLEVAHGSLGAAWSSMQGVAHVYPSLLLALANSCSPPGQAVIRGPEQEIRRWQNGCYQVADVRTGVYAIPDGETGLPGALAERKTADRTVAYLCEGFSCRPPYHSLEDLCTDLKQRAGE